MVFVKFPYCALDLSYIARMQILVKLFKAHEHIHNNFARSYKHVNHTMKSNFYS